MRLLFAGTPEFGLRILEVLIASAHEVLGVMTQPSRPKGRGQWSQPSPVAVRAQKENLPIITTSPSKPRVLDQIRALDPEAIVVAAYGRIFRPEFLALRMGGLDTDPEFMVKGHIFTSSKVPWIEINDGLPQESGGAPFGERG